MKNTSYLKAAYLAGSVADLTFGLLMIVFPSVCLKIYGINIVLLPEIRFWMAYAGIVIFIWTAFLIWGLMKLEERKFIALITVLVVLGLVSIQTLGIFWGGVNLVNMVPLFAMQFVLITLLLIGYRKA